VSVFSCWSSQCYICVIVRLKWSLPKILFLTSRYVVPPLLMIIVIDLTGYPLLSSFCAFGTRFHKPVSALSLFLAEIVLLIRVSALYYHDKIILSLLVCLFTCQFIAIVICTVFALTIITPVLFYEFLPGCWVQIRDTESALRWSYSWWIPFVSFDGILLVLTFIKAISYRDTPAIRLVARDSAFYFALMFSCLIANIAVYFPGTAIAVYIPTEWIACIAVSRMMMNIRGLTFDKLHSTRGLELSTLAFRRRVHTDQGDGRDTGAEQLFGPSGHV